MGPHEGHLSELVNYFCGMNAFFDNTNSLKIVSYTNKKDFRLRKISNEFDIFNVFIFCGVSNEKLYDTPSFLIAQNCLTKEKFVVSFKSNSMFS